MWLDAILLPSSLLTEPTTATVPRTVPCTVLSVSQSLSKSHPPVPLFSISSKISTEWTCVSLTGSITMQRVIVTHFLITSFSKFLRLALTAVSVLQVVFRLYSYVTSSISWLFLIYSVFIFIFILQPTYKPLVHWCSCLSFPNSLSSHLMQLYLYLQ